LDDNIYGLDKVKDRILEMIAVNRLKQEGGEKGGEKGEGKKGKG
jgi:ATP-dependent Lon protease